jgi:hypothetical protein
MFKPLQSGIEPPCLVPTTAVARAEDYLFCAFCFLLFCDDIFFFYIIVD